MIWFSGDSSDRILYEIQRDDRGEGFELKLIHSNGHRVLKKFHDAAELARGARKLQSELLGSGWRTSQRRVR